MVGYAGGVVVVVMQVKYLSYQVIYCRVGNTRTTLETAIQ